MLSGEPRISVSVLREAVREEVKRTSSHAVGREVGLSGPAVRSFVKGSEPREANLRKYTMWYIRYRQRTAGGTVDGETAAAALALLLEHIPGRRREEAAAELLSTLRAYCEKMENPLPAWFDEVQAEYD